MMDDKYVVFKKEDFVEGKTWREGFKPDARPLEDATVIRGQDLFAAPALHAYANAMGVAISILKQDDRPTTEAIVERMREVADYFHQRAVEAEEIGFKLPD